MQLDWTDLNDTSDGDNGSDGGDAGANGAEAAAAGQAATTADDADNAAKERKTVSDSEATLLKEVMEKKAALKEAREKAERLEAEKSDLANKLAELGDVDLDEVKNLLKERREREIADMEKKGEWDRLRAQMREEHTREMERVRAESASRLTELESVAENATKQIHELTIGRSFSESSFIREDLTLTPSKARVIYGAHFELVDGKVIAYDKPAGSAERTMFVDGDGEPLAFDKAIAKLVELDPDRDNLLRSKMRAGSGSENDASVRGKERQPELRGRDRIAAAVQSGALKRTQK